MKDFWGGPSDTGKPRWSQDPPMYTVKTAQETANDRLVAALREIHEIANAHYKLTKSSARRAFGDIASKCKEVL